MLDNNKDFLKVTKEFLQGHEFIGEVHTTSNEIAAFRNIKEKQPQIIDREKCIRCGACFEICKFHAVVVE